MKKKVEKVENNQKVLMWLSYTQTDEPNNLLWSWKIENAALWLDGFQNFQVSNLDHLFVKFFWLFPTFI